MGKNTSITLDDKSKAIVQAKAEELAEVTGTVSASAAIRSIILEWDWLNSMGYSKAAKSAQKQNQQVAA